MIEVAASSAAAATVQGMTKAPNSNTQHKFSTRLRRAAWSASCAFGQVSCPALPVGGFVSRPKPNPPFKRTRLRLAA